MKYKTHMFSEKQLWAFYIKIVIPADIMTADSEKIVAFGVSGV